MAEESEYVACEGTFNGNPHGVFTTPTGAPLNGRVVLSAFQRKLTDAGLPKVRFHDLRHSCSSLLRAKGISPRVVREQLGHPGPLDDTALPQSAPRAGGGRGSEDGGHPCLVVSGLLYPAMPRLGGGLLIRQVVAHSARQRTARRS
jgi:hypothetical protein